MTIAAETVREQTIRRFRTKRSPDGKAWKPSPNGMQDTGRLMNIHRIVRGLTARIGPTVIYGAIHQFGGTIKPRRASRLVFVGQNGSLVFAKEVKIPARPYLGVNERNRQEIENRITNLVRALIR